MSETLSQKAYWHIHEKLAAGSLKPGLRLSNRALAKEVGISFTPVREALNRLVSEGLLEYREGLGVFVPQATRREIEELYEVREMLECGVAARACGRLGNEVVQQLRELQRQMVTVAEEVRAAGRVGKHGERFRQLDSAFHSALLRAAGNRQLLETLTDLRRKCAIRMGGSPAGDGLIGHVYQNEPVESLERVCREHEELITLLEGHESEKASRFMSKHIRAGRELALAMVDRTYMNASRCAAPPIHLDSEETNL